MSARKTSPAVVQNMVVGLGTHVDGDECVARRAGCGYAPGDQIGTGTADGVFDEIGYETGQEHGDEEGEDGDVVGVGVAFCGEEPEDDG